MTKPSSISASEVLPPLAVTVGEPAGIGPDICLAIHAAGADRSLVFVGDERQLQHRAQLLGIDLSVAVGESSAPGCMRVLPIELPNPAVCGEPDPANANALLQGLKHAVDGCRGGLYSGVVTAPMQKSVINDAGIAFSGHTEYLAELCGVDRPVMMLAAGALRVALVTTHLPLRRVPDAIDQVGIVETVSVLAESLKSYFSVLSPRILVCGLNPHAGEGGHLGTEDEAIIAPAIEELRNAGIDAVGPLPADTAFTPAAGYADAVVAMYHDQGLPVLKHAGFGHAVNVTLGLPVVRTSVDHGTALDIAGKGSADPGSLQSAIAMAREMTAP